MSKITDWFKPKEFKQIGMSKVQDAILQGSGCLWSKAFWSKTGILVLYTMDKTPHGELKHISVSRSDRFPTWEELLKAKEYFIGDVDAMMVMPSRKDYVNLHKNCFHIWQTPEKWGIR